MSFSEDYPNLYKLGVKESVLLNIDDDLTPINVDVDAVTNETIVELFKFMNACSTCTYCTLRKWLVLLLGTKETFPTVNSIRQSVLRISAKLSKLKKTPNSKDKDTALSAFLNEPYQLPSLFVKCEAAQAANCTSSSTASCSCVLRLKLKNSSLHQELAELHIKASNADCTLRKKLYSFHRNTKKKLDRRDHKLLEETKKVCYLQSKVSASDSLISKLKVRVDRIRHRATYWKSKAQVFSEDTDFVDAAGNKCTKLKEEITQLEEENLDLHEEVDAILAESKDKIVTFENGRYTNDVRACCYELLSLNVGVNNIKTIITAVLNGIAHKEVDRLPRRSVLCNMMVECLTVAQAQLGEELSQSTAYNTLQTGGTTKYGNHFATFDVATTDGTFTLGLRHIFSGCAQTTLDTLLEILDDLDVVRKKMSQCEVSAKIISKIKNTMSDRHAAEKLFSHILSDYRETILPDVVAGWQDMSDEEHDQLTRMNYFFCGLHFLVGLADSAEATLKLWESTFDEEAEKKSSNTQRLIRTACKAFHSRGSEQAGCSIPFRTFLRHKGIEKLPLAAFKGNRFNIIFYDAAGVYYLKPYMIDYLTSHHGSNLNRLLQAVLLDLKSDCNIAGCRALGIVDKIVTGPFWRHLQTSAVSILDMSAVYTEMKEKFDEWGEDSQCLIDNQTALFPDFKCADYPYTPCLFEPTENDSIVQEVLQLLFKSFSQTIRRLLIDHLPGGEFHSVSDPEVISETKSVPKTNVSPERDFAILDRLMSQKPNATYVALESLLLYSHNKTSSWLHSKPPEEKERLIQAARSMTGFHRKTFLKRREAIEAKRIEAIKTREREMVKKKAKELKCKEDLTLRMQKIGLWMCCEEMDHNLEQISSKKGKVDALKLQINFRRKVLNQVHADKSVFQFSRDRKPFPVVKLAQNLSVLFSSGSTQQGLSLDRISKDPDLLLYRRFEHLFDCSGQERWFTGTVLSYDKETKEYTVLYDNEDESYNFPLLDDFEKGEVRVLS